MRVLRPSNCAAVTVTVVASREDPSEIAVFSLERSCCGGLLDGSGSWKIDASPELEGMEVGAVEELPEASVDAGQAGELREMMGIMLSSVMVWLA